MQAGGLFRYTSNWPVRNTIDHYLITSSIQLTAVCDSRCFMNKNCRHLAVHRQQPTVLRGGGGGGVLLKKPLVVKICGGLRRARSGLLTHVGVLEFIAGRSGLFTGCSRVVEDCGGFCRAVVVCLTVASVC